MLKVTGGARPWIQAPAQDVADYTREIAANWRYRSKVDIA